MEEVRVPSLPTVAPDVADAPSIKGVEFNPPPLDIFPDVMARIGDAIKSLPPGASGGLISIYEKDALGNVRANAALVQKIGGHMAVAAWIAKDWSSGAGITYGAATRLTW